MRPPRNPRPDPAPAAGGRGRFPAPPGAVLGILLAGAVLLAPGCGTPDRGGGEIPPPAPVVLGPAGPEASAGVADPWWRSLLMQCREAAADEDTERLGRLLSTLEGRPAPAWADQAVSRFRSLLRAHLLVEQGTLRALFILSRPDYSPGDTIWLRLRLENRSDGELTLPGAGGEGLVRSEMILEDRWASGKRERRRELLNFPLGASIVLAPGERREVGFEPITASLGGGVLLRTVTFEGRLLLGKIVAGGEELPLKSIPVSRTLLRIFPGGFEPIRSEPLLTLKRSLELGDRKHFPHIFLAAYFLRTGGYAKEALLEASGLLAEKLAQVKDSGDPLEAVLHAALMELSGSEVEFDAGT